MSALFSSQYNSIYGTQALLSSLEPDPIFRTSVSYADLMPHAPETVGNSTLPQNEFYGSSKRSFTSWREQHVRCGTLFEDPEFPANEKSLFYSTLPNKKIQWLRPKVNELISSGICICNTQIMGQLCRCQSGNMYLRFI